MDDRLYPPRPILSVSVAVFRGGRVLVGRRARAPLAGRFTLPGGVVEIGETLAEAAARELYEETGVEADLLAFNRHIEPILRESGRVRAHFVIASFVARWRRGEARVSEELDAVAWINPAELGVAFDHSRPRRSACERGKDRERIEVTRGGSDPVGRRGSDRSGPDGRSRPTTKRRAERDGKA